MAIGPVAWGAARMMASMVSIGPELTLSSFEGFLGAMVAGCRCGNRRRESFECFLRTGNGGRECAALGSPRLVRGVLELEKR